MKNKVKLTLLATSLMVAAGGANASLVLSGTTDLSAQGFGNAPRLLTLQAKGHDSTESAAIGISGGALVALTPGINDMLVYSGNGITNMGGDTVSPLGDNQKFGIPTLGSLGWTSGANVNLLFNAIEPGANGLTVNDVTLKFYNGDNVIASIDGGFALGTTAPGNGNAGFLITVDDPQRMYLDQNVFNQSGASAYRIALESTISGVAGGPESFSAIAAVPEPETYAMMLAGLGLLGFARIRKTRRKA